MDEARFHNQLGDEYELFKLACPHYDELQNSVGNLIKENFADSGTNKIKVLEIGFGAGATSLVILNADKRVTLTVVDNEPLMLSKTKESLASIEPERYVLHIQDALEFLKNCSENSFDVVGSAWVIHNFNDEYRSETLQEIHRVLKPGGLFINADKIEVTDREQHTRNLEWQINQFDIYDKIGKPELKKEWTEHYIEDTKPGRALIENEFEEAIKSCGFSSFKIIKRWYDDAVVLIQK